jgi:thiol-disulfide isomerase/thioredoxin
MNTLRAGAARLALTAVVATATIQVVPAQAAVSTVAAKATTAARSAKAAKAARYRAASIISNGDLRKTLAGHRGRVVVLHVWASWCAPCLDELPLMGQLARELRGKGVELVSVALDDPTSAAARRVGQLISERAGSALDNQIVKVDDPDTFIAGIDPKWEGTIPAVFFYDRQGTLRRGLTGDITREEIEKYARELLTPKN